MAGVITGQSVILFTSAVLEWGPLAANSAAVALGTVPNYTINRYLTWSKRDKNRLWGEIVPFWGMALLGLALSNWFVVLADERWGTPIARSAANMTAFGLLWVGKFVLLDKVLFTQAPAAASED